MSVENVKAFFKKIEEDESFRKELADKGALEKGNKDSIFKAAADAGYPFTKEELEQAKAEPMTDEQLASVAGGTFASNCLIIGQIDQGDPNGGNKDGFCIGFGISI